MLKKLKKNKKKGFTLVELIVVLVILAILAALLIPTLTGYIDKAKEKQITAETRQVVMAAQTLYDEQYGKTAIDATVSFVFSKTAESSSESNGTITLAQKEVAKLAEVTADNIDAITANDGIITAVTYKANGKQCVYARSSKTGKGTYTISKAD